MASAAPPAASGVTILIGRVGHSCAQASCTKVACIQAAPDSSTKPVKLNRAISLQGRLMRSRFLASRLPGISPDQHIEFRQVRRALLARSKLESLALRRAPE